MVAILCILKKWYRYFIVNIVRYIQLLDVKSDTWTKDKNRWKMTSHLGFLSCLLVVCVDRAAYTDSTIIENTAYIPFLEFEISI